MADKLNKLLGKGLGPVSDWATGSVFTSYTNKGWRAKILFNRVVSNRAKVSQYVGKTEDFANKHLAKPDSHSLAQYINPWTAQQIVGKKMGLSPEEIKHAMSTDHTKSKRGQKQAKEFKNEIIIVNSSVSPIVYLTLQNRPSEIEVEPNSYWTSVKSMGRNSPFQVYTGSEDTISLDISWFSKDNGRQDVINKCRLLESWTKSDGYNSAPPVLEILWGNSDLFTGSEFVLTAASYKLMNFQDGVRNSYDGSVIDLKLYPNTATQKLVFKRVSSKNLEYEDIIPSDKLKSTSGIKLD